MRRWWLAPVVATALLLGLTRSITKLGYGRQRRVVEGLLSFAGPDGTARGQWCGWAGTTEGQAPSRPATGRPSR